MFNIKHFISKIKNIIPQKHSTDTHEENVESIEMKHYNEKTLKEKTTTEYRQIVIHNISTSAILKTAIIITLFYSLSKILPFLGTLFFIAFISIIFASAIDPLADIFENHKIPRAVTVIFVYIVILSFIWFIFANLIPLFAKQIKDLTVYIGQNINTIDVNPNTIIGQITNYINQVVGTELRTFVIEELQKSLSYISSQLINFTSNTLGIIGNIFGSIVYFFTIMILTLYMVVDKHATEDFIKSILPKKSENYVIHVINKIKKKMGSWVRGQLILSIIIGVTTYICLILVDFKYALIVAMIAGLFEMIPIIGFWISFIIAVLLGFLQDPFIGIAVIIVFFIIQTIESQIFVPFIMKHSVGLSPVVIILAMLAGAQLFGIAGIILAIPVTASLSILLDEYTKYN